MNKRELVDAIARRTGLPLRSVSDGVVDATEVLDVVLGIIEETVAAREKVAITGFGVFEVTTRAAHTGRNPATGEAIAVPESFGPKFRAGNTFKAAVAARGAAG